MKKSFLSFVFSLFILVSSAQKVYFIYLQTESEQPFFVRMNNKVVSSTATGYLILPKLVDSTYAFTVGFPQNKWPDQRFTVTLNKKDHGFLIKNFDTKGWGLYDMQTLAVQMAGGGNTETAKNDNKDGGSFTDLLAKASDDPSLKEKPVQPKVEEKKPEVVKKEEPKVEEKKTEVVKKEEPKVEEKKTEVVKKEEPKVEEKKTEPVLAKTEQKKEEPKTEVKEEPVVKTEETNTTAPEPYKTSLVKKWSESSTTEGFGLVFIDDYQNGSKDTIRLVIPNPKPVINVVKDEPKEEKKFLEVPETAGKEEKPAVDEGIKEEKPVLKEKKKEEKTVVKKKAKEEEPVVTEKVKEEVPPVLKEEIKEVNNPVVAEPKSGNNVLVNNCGEVAVEADFFKLRKKMAGEEKEENMIVEAKKYFKTKCFTTAQIRNLSTLFLTDEGKYDFFDLAYRYVSDAAAFPSLQAELKDAYYSNRFKAMLRN